MTKFVSITATPKVSAGGVTEKYVKQTYDAMSNSSINLELVAKQISLLPVREQRKFLRLLFNYIDELASLSKYPLSSAVMKDDIELSKRIIDVVNDYYFEQDEKQLALEGM